MGTQERTGGVRLVLVLMGIGNLCLAAYALSAVWGWHLVPMGASPLRWASALALVLLHRALFRRWQMPEPTADLGERLRLRLGYAMALGVVLGVGWLTAGGGA